MIFANIAEHLASRKFTRALTSKPRDLRVFWFLSFVSYFAFPSLCGTATWSRFFFLCC